jgi:hypothetical protein
MKNQHFGGNRDLFKYDLVYVIMKNGLAGKFTLIPMLTAGDAETQAVETDRTFARAGTENSDLVKYLDGCIKTGKRDVKKIVPFFAKHDITIAIYGSDEEFVQNRRERYFKGINDALLIDSLVLVDPDTGLEVKRSSEKHLLYSELKDLYTRMDKKSILMVFQNFPRQPHLAYLDRMVHEIGDKITGDSPVCIDDDKTIFFFLTKNKALEKSLIKIMGDYTELYS